MTNNSDHNFLLYGDNFLECERFVDEVLCNPNSKLQFEKEDGKYLDRPILIFQDTETGVKLRFHLRPRFDAWKSSPLKKYMNENLDVFLFQFKDGKHVPILAVEYDDATQAGNQAWQRGNRAADAAKHKIPYLYVIPKETTEYNNNGTPKSIRHPTFLTPLSLTTLSCSSKQISLLITHSIKTNKETKKNVATIVSYLIRCTYCINIKKPHEELEYFIKQTLSYTEVCPGWEKDHLWKKHPVMEKTKRKSNAKKISATLLDGKKLPREIDLSKISANHFSSNPLPFTKLILEKTVKRKKFWSDIYNKLVLKKDNKSQYEKIWGKNPSEEPIGFGDYGSALITNKKVLKDILVAAYPAIKTPITQFIDSVNGSVLLHLMAGYKNTIIGGTSRPDTGYLASIQSLFPNAFQKKNSMVIIYSNGVPADWKARQDKGDNEFWKSVSNYTGYVIVDKYQNGREN